IALVAEQLGARHVPRSRQEIADYLQRIRPQLLCDERSREVLRLLLDAPAPSALAKPFGALMMQAGIDLLPDWAGDMLGQQQSPLQ
ncbi:oxygenase MpaB family protein, partial [Salmonella enterica subsp. enterica]